jgi:hypothetical protein
MLFRRLILWLALAATAFPATATEARIVKVLPHLLDLKGRHCLHPSLYERDGHQAYLRQHPAERSALRFDVQWKAARSQTGPLTLRIEAQGSRADSPISVEREVRKRGRFSQWTPVILAGEVYAKFGDLISWRATLWEGPKLLAEQKSFLW